MDSTTAIDPGWLAAKSLELEGRTPEEILSWSFSTLPGTVVTTAFQPGGIVLLDMLSELGLRPPVIFIDTLYQFPETLELSRKCQERFNMDLRIWKPLNCQTTADFERQFGPQLWEKDLDEYQDRTKVEPMRRAMAETSARGWMSGRRRDQGGERQDLSILELSGSRVKINPLAAWTRKDLWKRILERSLPYNPLHDQGYPSIGDWPLTDKADAADGERSGRWKGLGKTECGIHTSL